MNRGLSLYLDLLRFSAALEVFAYHLTMLTGWPATQPIFASFGHEAVVVFFVLSGYVIGYAARNRDKTPERYAVSRLTRIYSVAIPALLLTVALDHFGYSLNPVVYDGFAPLHSPMLRFGISVFLLNETWHSVQAFSNGPYWSVCYELLYYAIFAFYFFFDGRMRRVLLLASLLLAGPRALLLLPVWVMGSLAFFETRSRRWPSVLHWILFLLPVLGFWLYANAPIANITVRLAAAVFGWTTAAVDLGHSRQALSDWYLGVLLALHFVGAKNLQLELERCLSWIARPFHVCADFTFTLYLVHLPNPVRDSTHGPERSMAAGGYRADCRRGHGDTGYYHRKAATPAQAAGRTGHVRSAPSVTWRVVRSRRVRPEPAAHCSRPAFCLIRIGPGHARRA